MLFEDRLPAESLLEESAQKFKLEMDMFGYEAPESWKA